MTPAQLDKLRRIDAHLANLLSTAEKRTPGEWKAESSRAYCTDETVTHNVVGPPSDFMYLQELPDAAFIAACAGNAEAGWRATRAAIAAALNCESWDAMIKEVYIRQDAEAILESIIAAFPNV